MDKKEIQKRAAEVRDEYREGANTSAKVGGLMYDALTYLSDEVDKFRNFKGYYESLSALQSSITKPAVGNYAYVGPSYPGNVYRYTSSGWANTGAAGSIPAVNLAPYAKVVDLNATNDQVALKAAQADLETAQTKIVQLEQVANSDYSELLSKVTLTQGYLDNNGVIRTSDRNVVFDMIVSGDIYISMPETVGVYWYDYKKGAISDIVKGFSGQISGTYKFCFAQFNASGEQIYLYVNDPVLNSVKIKYNLFDIRTRINNADNNIASKDNITLHQGSFINGELVWNDRNVESDIISSPYIEISTSLPYYHYYTDVNTGVLVDAKTGKSTLSGSYRVGFTVLVSGVQKKMSVNDIINSEFVDICYKKNELKITDNDWCYGIFTNLLTTAVKLANTLVDKNTGSLVAANGYTTYKISKINTGHFILISESDRKSLIYFDWVSKSGEIIVKYGTSQTLMADGSVSGNNENDLYVTVPDSVISPLFGVRRAEIIDSKKSELSHLVDHGVNVLDLDIYPMSKRFGVAALLAKNSTITVPSGLYEMDGGIYLEGTTSLVCAPDAEIRAINPMQRLINHVGYLYRDTHVYYKDHNVLDINHNVGVYGGVFNGGNMASTVVDLSGFHKFTFQNSTVIGGTKGVYIVNGYELMMSNVIAKNYNTERTSTSVGLHIAAADCHFTDLVLLDYEIGVEVGGGSNRLTNVHVWGGFHCVEEQTINFKITGHTHTFTTCYADTGRIGYQNTGRFNRFVSCDAFNNYDVFKYNNVTYFDNSGIGTKVLGSCFTKTAPNTIYFIDTNNTNSELLMCNFEKTIK